MIWVAAIGGFVAGLVVGVVGFIGYIFAVTKGETDAQFEQRYKEEREERAADRRKRRRKDFEALHPDDQKIMRYIGADPDTMEEREARYEREKHWAPEQFTGGKYRL